MGFAEFLAETMPSKDEWLTMCAEGIWPPPSILTPADDRQVIWDGLATVKGLLEAYPEDQWPEIFPSAYEQED